MELKRTEMRVVDEKAILVGVLLPNGNADPRDPLGELASLVNTAGASEAGRVLQKRQRPEAGTYIGTGKVLEIVEYIRAKDANMVVFDNDLSPGQIGALEKLINEELQSKPTQGVKVLDRSELILDIFASRAQTHEAKLQVELAQMQYTYPRLTRMWGHLERIAGGGTIGVGTRGPGETQLEIDRRLVRKRVSALRQELEIVQARKSRQVEKRNQEHFTVCVVGYTNAGKSTLFNSLTQASTYADDKLFATLDTKTRAWMLDRQATVMLSDTVGFVRDLPHLLVASFKATLEEAIHADLLLHVLDVGHPRAMHQHAAVRNVLDEIGAGDQPELLLLNKIDTLDGEEQWPYWRAAHPDALPISAATDAGLEAVQDAVRLAVMDTQIEVTLRLPSGDGKLLARLERNARIESRDYVDGDVVLHARVGAWLKQELEGNPSVQLTTR